VSKYVAATLLLLGYSIARGEEPPYPHGEFQGDCTKCHGPAGWSPVRLSPEFDHAESGFPLDGAHARTACRACHATLDFRETADDCVSCHLDPHESELGLDCAACHTPRSFIDRSVMIRAHLATRLPLDGRHRTIDCEDCHDPAGPGTLQFVGLPVECYDCHSAEFASATEPDHRGPGFSRQCDRCHDTRAWEPARFNHSELPAGARCADCHLADYQGADDPDHEGLGFSLECQECHSTLAWRPAEFDHDALPPGALCADCHLSDYEGTDDPDHESAGFPLQCEDCHSTNSWEPATFDHDSLFPIYSGRHRNEWNECSDCHVNPSNYSVFSCLDCHEHDDPVDLADKHDEVSGYSYASPECYACHPDGRAED
jgi:hypothetical protein